MRLPNGMRTVRFRLAATYSLLLFALALAFVGAVYVLVARDLDEEPVSRTYVVQQPVLTREGVVVRQDVVRAQFQTLEHLVNQRALDQLRSYSLTALALLFLTSLGVGWLVAGRMLAPIGRIAGVAKQIQATDLARRIRLDGPDDELRDLADTFDGMLDRLQNAFDAQSRFIQEASHELRNPLAVMRTNLEVALADPEPTVDELRRTATVVARTTDRMARLVDDLLASARLGLPESAWEPVHLGEVVHEVVEEFRVPAAARSLTIASRADDTTVQGDRTALKQALANLLGNAVRLAPPASTVSVASGTTAGWAYLSVADQGPGIAEQDQEAVFQRFWRRSNQAGEAAAEPSSRSGAKQAPAASPSVFGEAAAEPSSRSGARQAPSASPSVFGEAAAEPSSRSGLGLTIVRQIAELHGGTASVSSEPGRGSTFVVWLPLA